MEVINPIATEKVLLLPEVTLPVAGTHENGGITINGSSLDKSVFFDKHEGENITVEEEITTLVTTALDEQNLENLKDKILSGLKASTSTQQQDNGKVTVDLSEVFEEDDDDDDDDDEIELEFERAIDKAHTHTPYCPNCSRQITKVILRRRKRSQPAPKSLNLLGCLSCFSIFIPSGDCLNPFRRIRKKWTQQSTQVAPPAQDSGHHTPPTALPETEAKPVGETDATSPDVSAKPPKDSILHIVTSTLLLGPRRQQTSEKQESKPFEDIGDALIHKPPVLPFSDIGDALIHKPPVLPFSDLGEALIHYPESQSQGITQPPVSTPREDVAIDVPEEAATHVNQVSALPEILRCIVYGGLMELIASLSVVSSAAASDATTLNIICIGLATLISGLFIFGHHLLDLKNDTSEESSNRYQEQLGRRGHFLLHSSLATLSYLFFGLLPPVVYGFAFRESDNKDYKILAVAAASFTSILILAITRAYVDQIRTIGGYIKTILYYITMAVSVSGVGYAVGHLVNILMERYGWFEPKTPKLSFFAPGTVAHTQAWGSY